MENKLFTIPTAGTHHDECFKIQRFGDIDYRDACLLSKIKEINGTRLLVLKAPKIYIWKIQNQCLFLEIMTQLLKIIHRPCWEQFHVGTVFFLKMKG